MKKIVNTQNKYLGFTLAEILITLGVVGVVAAVTLPTLVTNIQEQVRREQVRTVKYKLTKATEKMNSLGLIGHYDTTMDFVNELKKHMSIAQICDSGELDKCWPTEKINAYQNGSKILSGFSVKDLKTGVKIKALALGTKNSETVGIVTGEGIAMLIVYSPKCSGFDEAKQYIWTVENGKPVTNATTNCISAIFDINGAKGPNRIGIDVRTLNSLFGATEIGVPEGLSFEECKKIKTKYAIKNCCQYCDTGGGDRWANSIVQCAKLGLHLPNMATLANIANARYGTTQIGPYTVYVGSEHSYSKSGDCVGVLRKNYGENFIKICDNIICNASGITDKDSSLNEESSNVSTIVDTYWSNLEGYSDSLSSTAYRRHFTWQFSYWYTNGRSADWIKALCVGD